MSSEHESFHEAFSELFHSLKCLRIVLERSWIINCSNPFQTIRWRRQGSLAVRLMVRVHLRGGVRINSPPRRHRADCRLDHSRERRLQSRGQESVVQLPSDPDDWRLHHALRLLWVTCMRSCAMSSSNWNPIFPQPCCSIASVAAARTWLSSCVTYFSTPAPFRASWSAFWLFTSGRTTWRSRTICPPPLPWLTSTHYIPGSASSPAGCSLSNSY